MNLDWLGYEDIPFFTMLFLFSLIIYFLSKPASLGEFGTVYDSCIDEIQEEE